MKSLILSLIFLFFGIGTAFAQDNQSDADEGNGILVVSYFKCQYNKIGEVVEFTKEMSEPVLNKLVDEGKLNSWGSLTHLWGDEWNYLIYYNANNLAEFEAAFGEAVSSYEENSDDWMDKWSSLCSEHKDNVYSVISGYSGSE